MSIEEVDMLDLKPIKARLEAAPGPLSHDRSGRLYGPDRRPGSIITRTGWGYGATRAYRELLTHSAEDIAALIQEVERLHAAIQATYTAPDPAAFFAAERALREAVQGDKTHATLSDLIRQVEARGWLWEGGHTEHRGERGRFGVRVYLSNLDPLHYDEPADERYGHGDTLEEATRQAIEALPPDPYRTKE